LKPLTFASSFKRAYKATVRRSPDLQPKILAKLGLLSADPFDASLRTHKLKGRLAGAWSCSVEYDCRIVFSFVENPDSGAEEILLIDIGTHDEVY
jgi:addiction module RelE/StbE family toxin